jgi:hypothetical protein
VLAPKREARRADRDARRGTLVWQLLVVLAASTAFESLFVHHALNLADEGWPLYAAMRLQAGGTLYRDVFFVFPPGHVLAAWIARALDPPGVILARAIYAGFSVALCVAIYLLGRRISTPGFALLGALLLAFAAPESHAYQALFGYRYLVFGTLALLCFDAHLRRGGARWIAASGFLVGIALCFRLTPAFAAACGIAAGVTASSGDRRRWLRDGALFALGLALAVGPVLAWLAATSGLGAVWSEAVARPVEMTALQTRPMPELEWPVRWTRYQIKEASVAVLFRLCILLYLSYALWLLPRWLRALVRRERMADPLLLAVAVWGGVYFLRTLGRSDFPHLDSAIPPACLLAACALGRGVARLCARWSLSPARASALAFACGAAFFGLWVLAEGPDLVARRVLRGRTPLTALHSRSFVQRQHAMRVVDPRVAAIRAWTQPSETILDLSASPLFYVASDREGPGWADVVMPGTFRTPAEEEAFLERLRAAPPALVIFPRQPFDGRAERAVQLTAPAILRWVEENYEPRGPRKTFALLVRKDRR